MSLVTKIITALFVLLLVTETMVLVRTAAGWRIRHVHWS